MSAFTNPFLHSFTDLFHYSQTLFEYLPYTKFDSKHQGYKVDVYILILSSSLVSGMFQC
jgi:hypothetical protein